MLTADNTAVVLVDVQGKLAQMMPERETLFANLQIMVSGASVLDLPVFWVEQNPQKLGGTIAELAALLSDQRPFTKMTFSCAGAEGFSAALHDAGRKQLLVMGIEAHVCVYHTVLDLLAQGYEVEIVEDAIGSRVASNKQVAVRRLCASGASLTSTEMALFELLGSAEHPAFRQVQALLR
ncbi:MAG: hydrolase [Halioglobus sp.]|nr:hydrolase [Halioglobus sp.]